MTAIYDLMITRLIDYVPRCPYRSSSDRTRGSGAPSLPLSSHLNTIMSHTQASSSSNFQSVFDAALDAYEKKTESNLLTHPLAAQIQSCDSPTAILSVLQGLIQQFDRRRRSDQRLANWLKPTINVLSAFSATVGQGVSLVSPNSSSS